MDFKQRALEKDFCNSIQEGVRILFEVEKDPDFKLKAKMDIRKVLKKLKYENWEENKIEHFYLWRLRWAYFTMRKNLSKLYF